VQELAFSSSGPSWAPSELVDIVLYLFRRQPRLDAIEDIAI